jgi:hypothetical protein
LLIWDSNPLPVSRESDPSFGTWNWLSEGSVENNSKPLALIQKLFDPDSRLIQKLIIPGYDLFERDQGRSITHGR